MGEFKPGVWAAADDDTDQLSMMMMKGISDTFPGMNTHFTLSSDDQKDSDCYLDGHIDDYGSAPHVPHLKLRKGQVYLSVEGEIWLRETGEKMLVFQTSTVIDLKTQDFKTVAYQIGVAMAHFIGSQGR